MWKLLASLGLNSHGAPVRSDSADADVRIFDERAPNYIWSSTMWDWGRNTDASHFLSIQDDAIVAPNFWPALRAILTAMPFEVIGLEAVHELAKQCLIDGHHWYTSSDCLIGVAYALPRPVLREFLTWRSALRKGGIETITEDTMLGVFCLATGRKIWHPVPTIVDHDTEIPSTYGNDHHTHRRPVVTWRMRPASEDPDAWLRSEPVPHAGRFYEGTHRLARRWIPGATEEDYQRWLAT